MRVLIGYDGSPYAEDAITDLQRAGLPPDGAEALVCGVWDGLVPPDVTDAGSAAGTPAAVLRDLQRLRSLAQQSLEAVREAAE
jgi:hypothetical protein